MRLEYQILIAIVLDFLMGDPRWFPHPVKFIGGFAAILEEPLRRLMKSPKTAGIVTTLTVIWVTALVTFVLIHTASWIHPIAGDVVSILILYTAIGAKDLAGHSMNVYLALKSGDLIEARRQVSWMVGRDTDGLDESGIIRAAVESVAENTVDGVTAPLFYAILGGPLGAMVYKAINTLDSTFGYKNERYAKFGWASARIDDFATYIPARLTVPLIAIAATVLRQRAADSLRVCFRDGRKNPSPNSGLSESTVAGALGVQLGGPLFRKGKLESMPTLGEPIIQLNRSHIYKANALMFATSALSAMVFIGLRMLMIRFL